MFEITYGKGFKITFENSVTVSVQFGAGNYCNDYPQSIGRVEDYDKRCREQAEKGSPNAEIAIIGKHGWLTREFKPDNEDDVMGFQTPKQVLKALIWAENYKEEK